MSEEVEENTGWLSGVRLVVQLKRGIFSEVSLLFHC